MVGSKERKVLNANFNHGINAPMMNEARQGKRMKNDIRPDAQELAG